MKYIAHKWNSEHQLLGTDAACMAQVEMVAGVVGDLKGAVTMPCYTQSDKESIKANLLQKVKPIVAYLGDKDFLCGSDVTYVDFTMFELCELMQFISDGSLFTNYPKLDSYCARVKQLDGMSQYFHDEHACMKRPFNNKVAKINN